MANIEHSIITDPNIHEPKGVAAASSGQVYTANGTGSGSWTSVSPVNRVVVNALSDFPTPSGGVITLAANTQYYIGATNVDIGSNRILYGTNSSITGAPAASKITSSTTGNLFTAADAGVITLERVSIDAASATLFSVTDATQGTTTVIMNTAQIIQCAAIGTFTNILGLNFVNNSVLDADQGITMGSTNTVVSIRQFFAISTSATFKCLDLASSSSSTIELVDLALNAPSGAVGIAGSTGSANVASGSVALVSSCEFLGGMSATDGNILNTDVRWKFVGNSGISDTTPAAFTRMNGNATATVIATAGTPVKVAGTFTEEVASHFTTDATGKITYNGQRNLCVSVDIVLSAQIATGTDDGSVLLAKNGTVITNSAQQQELAAGDPRTMSTIWELDLAENDFLEIYVQNDDTTENITVVDAKFRIK